MADAGVLIRASRDDDVASIAAIYAHHVLHGVASFEEVAPNVEEMARRRSELIARDFPYFVAERDGKTVGYCYAGPYRARIGYRFSLEDSIYIDAAEIGRGIGRALLSCVIERSTELGYRQMVAVIGVAHVGVLSAIGFKFGRWVDSVLMQRPLGAGDTILPRQGDPLNG
jgi:L-amino acid N-acyltransferase YncA